MSIGLIIILILTFALVMGPISMLRPNPMQKNKERIRLLARSKGVHFAMRNIPRQADEQENPAALPVFFFPPPKTMIEAGWMLVRANYQHDIHFLGWWAWQGDVRAESAELAILKEQLPELPDTVRAVSLGREGICVYWNERGGDVVFQQVLELLEALKSVER